MKVTELEGGGLDYMVAKAEGFGLGLPYFFANEYRRSHYSSDWSLAGPIIARERIDFEHLDTFDAPNLDIRATLYTANGKFEAVGKTMLEAAMRCFVISRFGNVVSLD